MKKTIVLALFITMMSGAVVPNVKAAGTEEGQNYNQLQIELLQLQIALLQYELQKLALKSPSPTVAGISTSINDKKEMPLSIIIGGVTTETKIATSREEALTECKGIAFRNEQRGKLIECVYNSELIYSGSF